MHHKCDEWWNEKEMVAHILRYQSLSASNDPSASDYFTLNLYGPFKALIGYIHRLYGLKWKLPELEDFEQRSFTHILRYLPLYSPKRGKAFSWSYVLIKSRAANHNRDRFYQKYYGVNVSIAEHGCDVETALEADNHTPEFERLVTLDDFKHKRETLLKFWTPERITKLFQGKPRDAIIAFLEDLRAGVPDFDTLAYGIPRKNFLYTLRRLGNLTPLDAAPRS